MREASDQTAPIERVRRWRTALHVVLSLAMWATYALYWRVVLGRGVENEARIAGILLAVFLVLQTLLTGSWIAYNREVARRHERRRTGRPLPLPGITHDFVGRGLRSFPGDVDLTRVPVVVIRVEGEAKIFETGIPLGGAALAPEPPGEAHGS